MEVWVLLQVKHKCQCFMQRPVHPSYGRVKHNLDGCLFVCGRVRTGKKKKKFFFFFFFFKFFVSGSPVHRTAQGALQSALHVMLLSYYIGVCVFHERQRGICRRRAYSQGFTKAGHMSNDRQHFYPA